jgi:hypothetical protein
MMLSKIKCPNCRTKGDIRDEKLFSVMGKHSGYPMTECVTCGERLVYNIPIFKRAGGVVVGVLVIWFGIHTAITAGTAHFQGILFVIAFGLFLLLGFANKIKVKKTFKKGELPRED